MSKRTRVLIILFGIGFLSLMALVLPSLISANNPVYSQIVNSATFYYGGETLESNAVVTDVVTPSPTPTSAPTAKATPTPTPKPPTPTPVISPTIHPTPTTTPTPTPTATPTFTPTPTASPSIRPTPTPIIKPKPQPKGPFYKRAWTSLRHWFYGLFSWFR